MDSPLMESPLMDSPLMDSPLMDSPLMDSPLMESVETLSAHISPPPTPPPCCGTPPYQSTSALRLRHVCHLNLELISSVIPRHVLDQRDEAGAPASSVSRPVLAASTSHGRSTSRRGRFTEDANSPMYCGFKAIPRL